MALFRGKRGLFWLGWVLFGGEALGVKNRAKMEKTRGRPPVWSSSGAKRVCAEILPRHLPSDRGLAADFLRVRAAFRVA